MTLYKPATAHSDKIYGDLNFDNSCVDSVLPFSGVKRTGLRRVRSSLAYYPRLYQRPRK